VYRGDSVQQGEGVGASRCSDIELEKVHAVGPLDTTKGNDIILWVPSIRILGQEGRLFAVVCGVRIATISASARARSASASRLKARTSALHFAAK
jgi:hypothetical protein